MTVVLFVKSVKYVFIGYIVCRLLFVYTVTRARALGFRIPLIRGRESVTAKTVNNIMSTCQKVMMMMSGLTPFSVRT